MKIKFAILNLILAFVLAAGFFAGYVQRPFIEDQSHITVIIAVIAVAALWRAWLDDWDSVRWLAWIAVNVGLAGTVLGIILTVSSVGHGDTQQVLTQIATGSGIALWPNLLGCLTYIWLSVNAKLLANEDI